MATLMRALAITAAAACLGACSGAVPRVWGTAHRTLPAGVDRVVYADLTALRGTRAEAWIYRRAARIMGLVDNAGTMIKRQCAIDPSAAELIFATEGYRGAVMFVRVPGRGQREITACAEKLLHARARRDGKVVVLDDGERIVGEILWVTSEVFAFVIGMPDRETLLRLAGGSGGLLGDRAFAEGLVTIDYQAPVWGVMVPPTGSEARGAISFQVSLVGGQIGVEARVPAGNVLRAWGMARSVRRLINRWDDEVSNPSVAAEGSDVIIQFLVKDHQIDRALERLVD